MSSTVGKYFLRNEENKAAKESLRERVYKKTNSQCWYCGDSLHHGNRTMDHVIPRAKGGPDSYENLVPCDKECNRIKGDSTIEVFRKRIRWKMNCSPEFSHEQNNWLYEKYGITVEPPVTKFWFEMEGLG